MPAKAVVDAVETRIGTTWNGLPVIGVNKGGDTPDDASSFIVVQYPIANVEQMTLGRVYREEGAFRIVINSARGDGIAVALGWADQLAALFRTQRFGGIRTWTPGSPIIDDNNDQGSYFQLSFAVPYTYDMRNP